MRLELKYSSQVAVNLVRHMISLFRLTDRTHLNEITECRIHIMFLSCVRFKISLTVKHYLYRIVHTEIVSFNDF